MSTKEVIEELREELASTIEDADELTRGEVLEISQELDKEIYNYYSKRDKKGKKTK